MLIESIDISHSSPFARCTNLLPTVFQVASLALKHRQLVRSMVCINKSLLNKLNCLLNFNLQYDVLFPTNGSGDASDNAPGIDDDTLDRHIAIASAVFGGPLEALHDQWHHNIPLLVR